MHNETLFVIPVYHRRSDVHADIMSRKKKKYVEECMMREHHLSKKEHESFFDINMWVPWKYSQIIGYIEIIYGNEKTSRHR